MEFKGKAVSSKRRKEHARMCVTPEIAIPSRFNREKFYGWNTMNIRISRRDFTRLLGAGAAAALVRPAVSFAKQPEHAPTSGQVVRLSANENP
jgi:hypothetical protein